MAHKEIVGAAPRRERLAQAVAAHRDGDYSRALQLCDSLLRQFGESAELLNFKAVVQAESGQMIAARDSIQAALEAADSSLRAEPLATLHLHAARILAELDLFSEALQHARRADELVPGQSGHAYQHARLALLSGETNESSRVLAGCLEQFPDFEEGRMLQCQMAMEQGDLDSAAAVLRNIVERNPLHARAWSGLADIARAEPGDEPLASALMAIHAAGPDSEASDGDWASATFALATMHRRHGNKARAFELARMANGNLREDSAWDMESWEARVEATLNAARQFQLKPVPGEWPQPLLIVGMPRSGSTLLEHVLAAHPEVAAGGERSAMAHIERFLQDQGHHAAAAGLGIEEQTLASMRSFYCAGMPARGGARWVSDKALRNFERLGLAMALFPGCKVLWIVRRPADAILSSYFQDFQHGLGYSHSLSHMARMYLGHWRLMQKWTECFDESIHRVDYPELVRSPETVIQGLCDFLGVEFKAAMLRPDRHSEPARTASVLQVQRPIHTEALDRWRDFEGELTEVIDHLRQYGVPVDEL